MISGMSLQVQFDVPCAATTPVFEFSQLTEVTPTLSEAVPLKVMAAAEVATLVNEGEAMASDGGVVSFSCGVV